MLHRGAAAKPPRSDEIRVTSDERRETSDGREFAEDEANTLVTRHSSLVTAAKRLLNHLVNITPDYTRGDRIVTWIVFVYSIIYKFLIAFVGVAVLGRAMRWGARQWSGYFFVVSIAVPAVVGLVTTVWFGIGTVRDLRQLFRDLETRVRDDRDNGMVEQERGQP